jgi:transcriptional regulator with XRE-family HTH domain
MTSSERAGGVSGEVVNKMISRAIGEELRRAREASGLTQAQLVEQLPSGIGERTLLSYEHGTRNLTALRLVEVCRVLDVGSPHVLGVALQRARIYVENLVLWVDLRALLADTATTDAAFRPMVVWARRTLARHPHGIVEVAPAAVEALATMIGRTRDDLAAYLARFLPELDRIPGQLRRSLTTI